MAVRRVEAEGWPAFAFVMRLPFCFYARATFLFMCGVLARFWRAACRQPMYVNLINLNFALGEGEGCLAHCSTTSSTTGTTGATCAPRTASSPTGLVTSSTIATGTANITHATGTANDTTCTSRVSGTSRGSSTRSTSRAIVLVCPLARFYVMSADNRILNLLI